MAVKGCSPDDDEADPFGDWRIVRVRALEQIKGTSHPCSLPPILLRNLCPLRSTSDPTAPPAQLLLSPTSFPPSKPPPIPIAISVTLERIASPTSTSKLLQKEVVSRLRSHFERQGAGRRVLKVGDVIGVGVDEGAVDEGEEEGPASNIITGYVRCCSHV